MTAEISALVVYVVLLVGGSYYFHRRYTCVKASILAGLVSSFVAIAVIGFVGDGDINPLKYLGAFFVYGLGLWAISALLSGFIGLATQLQKD